MSNALWAVFGGVWCAIIGVIFIAAILWALFGGKGKK